jgi:hypothetical protein
VISISGMSLRHHNSRLRYSRANNTSMYILPIPYLSPLGGQWTCLRPSLLLLVLRTVPQGLGSAGNGADRTGMAQGCDVYDGDWDVEGERRGGDREVGWGWHWGCR